MRDNEPMSDAGDFIDAALQREGSWYRAEDARARLGSGLRFYGASVGAVRGTVRDALRRHRGLAHDEITALSSELWAAPVFERRLAAIVILQSSLRFLDNTDLTRIEGFLRGARVRELADPLAVDVVGPMIEGLAGQNRERADVVLDRWVREPDAWLRRAALLCPLRALRAGGGDWDGFVRHANSVFAEGPETGGEGLLVREAIDFVLSEMARVRPGLELSPRDA